MLTISLLILNGISQLLVMNLDVASLFRRLSWEPTRLDWALVPRDIKALADAGVLLPGPSYAALVLGRHTPEGCSWAWAVFDSFLISWRN